MTERLLNCRLKPATRGKNRKEQHGGGAYKPGIVLIDEELSWARRCHFSPLEWQVHTCHTGAKLSTLVRIGKKNTESHGGGAFQNNKNNGGGAYKRRLRKERNVS